MMMIRIILLSSLFILTLSYLNVKTSISSPSPRKNSIDNDYDIVIIGAGIGGLSAGAILSSVYKKKVGVFEAHYHAGGVAHSFPIVSKSDHTYLFDAGPTIILGASSMPYNPLRQVLDFVGASCEWIPWYEWGMVTEHGHWDFKLGEGHFEKTLLEFGGIDAVNEFKDLRKACIPLTAGAAKIPTRSLRGDSFKLLPLLKHYDALQKVIPYADVLDGSFEPFMKKYVKNKFLQSWLDALAFSLSGLNAAQTGAAAMAYTIFDLHRNGATLDYPAGGVGTIAEVLSEVIQATGGHVHLSKKVSKICVENNKAVGIKLSDNTFVKAKRGVINNANIWSLGSLLADEQDKLTEEQRQYLIVNSAEKKETKSFLHLHLGLDTSGLDLNKMKAHYTVMDIGLQSADPCLDRNMVAVSNPSLLDKTLVKGPDGKYADNKIMIHAYGAGNENYDIWNNLSRDEYEKKKLNDSEFLYRSISRALDISIDEIKRRSDIALVGTPLTHERFNRRYKGTYGSSWGSMISTPVTPLKSLYLAGDSVFPGIGIPAVALSGAIAANTMINPLKHFAKVL